MVKAQQQKGMALIMVLLVVALASIIATGMSSQQQISTRRTENLLNNEQAYLYLLGAEDWARKILMDDHNNNKIDSLADDWAKILPAIPVEGGAIQGKLEDLQARFNLNTLVNGGKVSKEQLQQFRRLLDVVGISTFVSDAVVDWIDNDEEPMIPNGVEDGVYITRPIPYRTGNTFMASTSELMAVEGFDYKKYKSLEPFINALPVVTKINVNTTTAEVISSLFVGVNLGDAKTIIKDRPAGGYDNVSKFLQDTLLKGKKVDKQQLTVKTKFFLLTAEAVIGNKLSRLYSVIYRDDKGKTKVLMRSQRGI